MPTSNYNIDNHRSDFSVDDCSDLGLLDILTGNKDVANILVYNGCTGSFLDNVTRGGKLTHKLLHGIKRDCVSLSATLKYIQNMNRDKSFNIQVYLCGAPNILGIHATDFINCRLKRISKEYANVNYIRPIASKGVYIADGRIFPSIDIHYDEVEYLKLNNAILKSISDNYLLTYAIICIDKTMKKLSTNLEFERSSASQCYMLKMIDYWCNYLDRRCCDVDRLKKNLCSYFIDRYPYDYYYIDKSKVINLLRK